MAETEFGCFSFSQARDLHAHHAGRSRSARVNDASWVLCELYGHGMSGTTSIRSEYNQVIVVTPAEDGTNATFKTQNSVIFFTVLTYKLGSLLPETQNLII